MTTVLNNNNSKMVLIAIVLFAILLAAVSPKIFGLWAYSTMDDTCDTHQDGHTFFFYILTPEVEHCVGRIPNEKVADAFERLGSQHNFDKILEMFFRALVGQGPMP